MKKFLSSVVLCAISILVALLVAEAAVRLLKLADRSGVEAADQGKSLREIVSFDPVLETRYQPKARTLIRSRYGEFEVEYQTNELGLRERSLAPHGRNPFVILALGNSFVEGWGLPIEQTFLRIAEDQVNQALSRQGKDCPQVQFINAGMSGYGTTQSYLLLKELLPRLKPKAVLFFYIGTMVHDDYKFLRRAELDQQGLVRGLNAEVVMQGPPRDREQAKRPAALYGPTFNFLCNYSKLFCLVRFRLSNYYAQKDTKPGDPSQDMLAAYRAEPTRMAEVHGKSLAHLAAMGRLAREMHLPFAIIHLPMPHQLSAQEWGMGRKAYGLTARQYEAPDRPVLEKFAQQEGLTYQAAHDHLAGAAAVKQDAPHLYYTYDFHFNRHGAKVFGQWLSAYCLAWLDLCRSDGKGGK